MWKHSLIVHERLIYIGWYWEVFYLSLPPYTSLHWEKYDKRLPPCSCLYWPITYSYIELYWLIHLFISMYTVKIIFFHVYIFLFQFILCEHWKISYHPFTPQICLHWIINRPYNLMNVFSNFMIPVRVCDEN